MRARVLIRRITRAPGRWRRRRTLYRTIAAMNALGLPIYGTEWQMYRRILRSHRGMRRAAAQAGVTAEQAGAAFQQLGRAMNEAGRRVSAGNP